MTIPPTAITRTILNLLESAISFSPYLLDKDRLPHSQSDADNLPGVRTIPQNQEQFDDGWRGRRFP
jgi:hypothetical protein